MEIVKSIDSLDLKYIHGGNIGNDVICNWWLLKLPLDITIKSSNPLVQFFNTKIIDAGLYDVMD